MPRDGLSETFVEPALKTLRRNGATVSFNTPLRALEFAGNRVAALMFEHGSTQLNRDDELILATPAAAAARVVPGLVVPNRYSPIVNAHFRCVSPAASPMFIGVIGGSAQWIFRKREVLSVTVSAAQRIVDRPIEELSEILWHDVAIAYNLPVFPTPAVRIVKERRATFLASPEQLTLRPGSTTQWQNLMLTGDYTDTGLPATIEGAIGSGFTAAELLLHPAGQTSSLNEQKKSRFPTAIKLRSRQQQQLRFR